MTSPASSISDDWGRAPAELRFEPLTPGHAEDLEELFERNSASTVKDTFDPFVLSAERAQEIARNPNRDRFYVARRAGRLVAFSMLRGFDEGYEVPSFGIFVDHACHGEGIGRRMTEWTITQARCIGCRAVRLSVYQRNLAAVSLYESLGFDECEREMVSRGGRSNMKLVMRLEIDG